jgi:hypothetical protein
MLARVLQHQVAALAPEHNKRSDGSQQQHQIAYLQHRFNQVPRDLVRGVVRGA